MKKLYYHLEVSYNPNSTESYCLRCGSKIVESNLGNIVAIFLKKTETLELRLKHFAGNLMNLTLSISQ